MAQRSSECRNAASLLCSAPVTGDSVKGIVFNLLEEVVVAEYGPDTWDSLLNQSDASGAYTSLGSYPDGELQTLILSAAEIVGKTPTEFLRWFGQRAMGLLLKRYPAFFQSQPNTRMFILSVNDIIHPEVRKVYPGADVPVFDFRDAADGGLLMGYRSPRRLCALAQGFAEGAAAHYGEQIDLEHLQCMHKGDEKCLIHIRFS
jgi:hypothetical protein